MHCFEYSSLPSLSYFFNPWCTSMAGRETSSKIGAIQGFLEEERNSTCARRYIISNFENIKTAEDGFSNSKWGEKMSEK